MNTKSSQAKPKPSEHDDATSTRNREGREGGERGDEYKAKTKPSQSKAVGTRRRNVNEKSQRENGRGEGG